MTLPQLTPSGNVKRSPGPAYPPGPQKSVAGWGVTWFHPHPVEGVYHLAICADSTPKTDSPISAPTKMIDVRMVLPCLSQRGYPMTHAMSVPESAVAAFPALANLLTMMANDRGIGASHSSALTLAEVTEHIRTIRDSLYGAPTGADAWVMAKDGLANLLAMIEGAA